MVGSNEYIIKRKLKVERSKMKKNMIYALMGIIFLGIVVFLGVKSINNNFYIVPFGIASAIVAPMGLSALGYSFKTEDPTLKKLALIPEIDSLIEKAETEAEKIECLKIEKKQLLEYIKHEVDRAEKIERKKVIEGEILRILNEYRKVLEDIKELPDVDENTKKSCSEVEELYELLKEHEIKNSCPPLILNIFSNIRDTYFVLVVILAERLGYGLGYIYQSIVNIIEYFIKKNN